jgi:3',5'-cyclic AMP phosphodiesterase CpdA
MKKFILFILTFLICTTAVYARNLKFVQVTDVHLSADGCTFSNRDVANSVQGLKNAVNSINKLQDVDFVVFSGDNIDSSSEDDLKVFCEITQKLKRPYYIIMGNHDAYRLGGMSKKTYLKILRKYDKYQKSENSYFCFCPNSQFIVIFMDGVTPTIPSTHGYFPDEMVNWLDNILEKYKDKKAIIVQHFPLLPPSNNKSHNVLEPEKYFEVLTKHKNVFAILSGHYHLEKVMYDNGIYHISTPALVEPPYEYRIIEIDSKFNLKTNLIELDK